MLAILASVTVLYLSSSLLVPIVIACLAYLILRPVVCRLCKRGLSQMVASSVVILVLFGMLGLVVGLLYPLAVILGEEPIETIESDEMLEKDEPIKAAAVSQH